MTEIVDRRGAFRVPEAPVEGGRQAVFRLFAWGSRVFHGLYDFGLLRGARAPLPVISVGALTFGGSAKTPTTRWLARRLLARGWRVAILLRGYKAGQGTACRRVVPEESGAPGESDEALLLARTCPGALVFVGANREESCRLAVSHGANVCLLDDGHQHRRLEATGRLLLWDKFAEAGVRNGGHALREGAAGLERATWVLRCDRGTGMPAVPPLRARGVLVGGARLFPSVQRARLCRFAGESSKHNSTTARITAGELREAERNAFSSGDVWGIEYVGAGSDEEMGAHGAGPEAGREPLAPLSGITGQEDGGADFASMSKIARRKGGSERLVALSGIARAEGFEEMLLSLGFGVRTSFRYPDHHRFTNLEVEDALRAARDQDATTVALTAKDAARFFRVPKELSAEKRLSEFPLLVFDLEVEVDSEEQLLSSIERRIREVFP